MNIDPTSRSLNLRRAAAWVDQAAAASPPPDLVCLPARCSGHVAGATAAMTDGFFEVLAAHARDQGIALVWGAVEYDNGRLHDTAVWCDADGDVILRHRRLRPPTGDAPAFGRGTDVQVADTWFGPATLLIGDDLDDDTLLDGACHGGARLVVVPTLRRGIDAAALARRAQRHGLHLVVANAVSPAADGGSCVIGAHGTIVACAQAEPTLLSAQVAMETPAS